MENYEPPPENATKTAEELFLASFEGDYEDDAPWYAVKELRRRGTPDVFELAGRYLRSSAPVERARALDVLAQLGGRDHPYLAESVSIAEEWMRDGDPLVVDSAAWALSHLRSNRAVAVLIQSRHHPDPDVRWAVACGVAGSGDENAISTLVELMEDSNDDVRNWATFGLGSQCKEDSSAIRDALRLRLNDPFDDARMEAIWGLAHRKDREGLQLLLDRLSSDHWSGDEMEAVEILDLDGNPSIEDLCSGLQRLLNGTDGAGSDSVAVSE